MRDLADRDLERLFELDDRPGPAHPIDDARAQAILSAALGGAGFAPPGSGGGGGDGSAGGARAAGPAAAARAGGRARLAVLGGGAAAITIAVVAWIAARPSPQPAVTANEPPGVEPRATPAAASPGANTAAEPPGARGPAQAAAEPPGARRPGESDTQAAAEPPGAHAVSPAPPTAEPGPPHRPTRRAPGAPPRSVVHRAGPEIAVPPDDLLAEANAARAAQRWRAADALYSRVIARVAADRPATLAVQTALVASASIHLEHLGDPAGAARRFRDALAARPQDALAEEARWGLVEAARAQADRARELRALDDFLIHHPGSVLAPRARTRHAELGAGQ